MVNLSVSDLQKQIARKDREIEKLKGLEQKFRLFYQNSPLGFQSLDEKGNFLDVNPAWLEMMGYERDEVIGKYFAEFLARGFKEDFNTNFSKFKKAGDISYVEFAMKRKDGSLVDVSFSGRIGKKPDGSFDRTHCIITDITQRKRAEEALQASEKKHKSLYSMMRLMCDNVPDMIWAKDLEKKYIFANKAICENLLNANDTHEPSGKTDIFFANRERDSHPDVQDYHTFGEICADSDEVVLQSKKPHRFDEFGNIKGEFLRLDVYKAPFWDENGQMIGTVGCGRDVTAEKRAEEALRESEGKYQLIVENTDTGFVAIDETGEVIDANEPYMRLIGVDHLEKIIGHSVLEWTAPEERENNATAVALCTEQGYIQDFETIYLNRDGIRKNILINAIVTTTPEGKHLHSLCRDITERKQADEELRESEIKYRSVVQTAGDAIIILDEDKTILSWNRGAEQVFGFLEKEVIGKSIVMMLPENQIDEYKSGIEGVETTGESKLLSTGMEMMGVRKNGVEFPIDLSLSAWKVGDKAHLTMIVRDISERKKTEADIRSSLKEKDVLLEEVHHRVKNNLQVISSLLNLQAKRTDDGLSSEVIRQSQDRIKTIALVHEKLYQSKDFTQINWSDYINTLVRNLRYSYRENPEDITLQLEVQDFSGDIDTAIPCALIVNELVTNSLKHGFAEGEKGIIHVSLRVADQGVISLVVGDNGGGLPEGFDITKSQSLGLQLVQTLIEQMDGTLKLYREHGTEFNIEFEPALIEG
ncbi:hypothetical protein CEE37_01745 [candidate division LCP-89 bacterium B3_LCP]|uniref:PAS domain S-box protein n=1 Tax=candidate division LCP-89 bacterium B3_LCP TaxID=2012998 RepID=A0A532V5G3_UNCL8|nr:MAG: hypothetical protein CEE37_01745 [candidate division LCP-89 bacterium B3_LCP]